MQRPNSLNVSRNVFYFLYLHKEEWEECLPEGVYAILGKVLQEPFLSRAEFISLIEKEEKIPAVGFAFEKESFSLISVKDKGVIVKEKEPVIAFHPFTFLLTSEGKLLENTKGKDAVTFGISVSYPTLYSIDGAIKKTREELKEAEVFTSLRSFIRKQTFPPRVRYKGEPVKTSFRVGKLVEQKAKKKLETIEGLEVE